MIVFIFLLVHIEDLYCFHYTSSLEEIPRAAGWSFFDLETEFQRMGVPNGNWTMTNLNKDYQVLLLEQYDIFPCICIDLRFLLTLKSIQLCDTYPQCLFVPSSVSTIVLVGSASFRSKGRLPVLTYLHKNQVHKSTVLFCFKSPLLCGRGGRRKGRLDVIYITWFPDFKWLLSIRRPCAGVVSRYPDSAPAVSKTNNYWMVSFRPTRMPSSCTWSIRGLA